MHQMGSGKIKRTIKFYFNSKNRSKLSYINNKKKRILNERIKNFYINSDFKRSPDTFDKLAFWKSNQYLDYFFYISPIILKSILNDTVYKHHFLLIYIISKLFNGNITSEELDTIDNLIDYYLSKLDTYYAKSEFTINCHQLKHLTTTVRNYGPLKYLNGFIFEHNNGQLKKIVKSGYGIIEQIMEKFEIKFIKILNYKSNENQDNEIITGTKYKLNQQICYKNIFLDHKKYSSYLNNNSRLKDYYVRIENNQYFKVNYFFENNSNLFFEGELIEIIDNLEERIDQNIFKLEYIFNAIQTSIKYVVNVNLIVDRVLFSPSFEKTKSNHTNNNTGFIINFIHNFHN